MTGKITKINGSVIEVGFADKGLPKINAALRLDADGKGQFVDAYTIDEMYQTILKLLQKGKAV